MIITIDGPAVELRDEGIAMITQVKLYMSDSLIHMALASIWSYINCVNAYFHAQEPWKVAKRNHDEFKQILSATAHGLQLIATVLWPIMPTKMELLLASLGVKIDAENDLKKFYHPHASSQELIFIFRLTIVVVSLIAFVIAQLGSASIFDLVQFSWGGLGAAFGPLTLLSLYMNDINRYGAFWGILTGVLVSIIWRISGYTLYGYVVNEVLPGFLIGMLVIVIVSKITCIKNSRRI